MWAVAWLILAFIVGALMTVDFFRKYLKQTQYYRNGKKRVQMVPWCFPLVGHGIQFSRDTLGFIKNCAKKYGPVFRIKVFRTEYIVVCEREMTPEFFKAGEETLSLNEVLSRFFFDDGFGNPPNPVTLTTAIVRKSIAIKYDEFVPKIQSEAEKMIKRLQDKCVSSNGPLHINLTQEMFTFIANTSARCFLGFELDDELMGHLRKFTDLINGMIIATYFLPKSLLKFIMSPFLNPIQRSFVNYFAPYIQLYRDDPEKRDSLIIRTAVDHVDEETGEGLTNEGVSALLLTLLYVSSENTALGLTNSLIDLACHRELWNSLQEECKGHFEQNDIRALLNSNLLNACIMESARMTPHIFPLNRKPQHADVVLGDYYVGDSDAVALCSPLLMREENASCPFRNPLSYNPSRFLKEGENGGGESFNSKDVMTWGSGLHLCPGKVFALYEIKMAIGLILLNFHIDIRESPTKSLNYFSPAAFAEREVEAFINTI